MSRAADVSSVTTTTARTSGEERAAATVSRAKQRARSWRAPSYGRAEARLGHLEPLDGHHEEPAPVVGKHGPILPARLDTMTGGRETGALSRG